jgi:cbb3-type cytochrome oxidase subunit 1
VVAHAHLAALGLATMIVMAAGYRLLPMMSRRSPKPTLQ